VKLLLHICCGVCLGAPLKQLRNSGVDVIGFFYNPNIHPFLEFQKRLRALRIAQEAERLELVCHEDYGLYEFLKAVRPDDVNRCEQCYLLRLRAAALAAKAQGCDAFTTTLLISPHQKHERVRSVGEQVGAETGVRFDYHDWRPLFHESHEQAKKRSLYRQQYCGCIFSEYERFRGADPRR